MTHNLIWKFVYKFWPPILRFLEFFRIHRGRQPYHVGYLKNVEDVPKIKMVLVKHNFEDAILAWKDSGELLSMRKIDNKIFQHHVRFFSDGEVRCHYEYSSEGSPWGHVRETFFEPRKKYFLDLLSKYLK